ncbi:MULTISPECIES: hypothetical protein [unclassified Neisseria]|uniref:hypothetical protein n=1 Tax=unclassified Neisseria TaxID=2623750 RepID=UPI0026664C72|nr:MULTISPECIES: hypothetical protein [unclassified Neisseria]MDO1510307.1 hypothetical protein [Neisseria sp. MVDL19-042950]MDO1516476.1 hypothetical protein [Neisseria sp. MVDL18-041461]MDO1563624.1 hypothetical protein [Neisseria sp. MVDL20-010259]
MNIKRPTSGNITDNQTASDEFDWERGLEQLREKRQQGQPNTASIQSARQTQTQQPTEVQLQAREAEKVLREYLKQWQKEHNDPLSDTITAETDTTVLLQEDWLAAQTALQTAVSDDKVQRTRNVWLNPKRQTVEFVDPRPAAEQQEKYVDETAEEAAATVDPEEWLPVTVKVLEPQVNPRQPVMCLSEQELLDRLSRRLRPHLTDAIAGMVRVAVQKQTATLTYQLQQVLSEQAPSLVDEILEYNLKAAMSEIKYSLKYKR